MTQFIRIRGARTHNLQNCDIDLPRNQFIVITGLSGSGKSSLAFDTLYAEGQRRYVESLSAYARQFLSMMDKPEVDLIEGLSPAIAIEQKSTSHNPRSTVGTVTEIYDYLRLLFARVGTPRCPDHHLDLDAQTVGQMVDQVLELPTETPAYLVAPLIQSRKGEYLKLFDELRAQGFIRVRVNNEIFDLENVPKINPKTKNTIEAVVDRFKVKPDLRLRLAESFETALRLSNGIAKVIFTDQAQADLIFSSKFACPICDYSLQELSPRLFSFNNPAGACTTCDGLGVKQFFDPQLIVSQDHLSLANGAIKGWDRRSQYYFPLVQSLARHYHFDVEMPFNQLPEKIRHILLFGSQGEEINFDYVDSRQKTIIRRHSFEGIIPQFDRRYRETESPTVREELARYLNQQVCPDCGGSRLNRAARNVFVKGKSIFELTGLPIGELNHWFRALELSGHRAEIAKPIVKEINARLGFLVNVGLDYLTLARSADSLSGGEAQRIRLASQIGAGLVGVMYVLDEPSIGLHQRDNARLLQALLQLRDLGNTVIVVEHDEDAIRAADFVVDMGPGAGIHGGNIVASGPPNTIMQTAESLTGQYLSQHLQIALPNQRKSPNADQKITLHNAHGNNLQNVDVEIPLGLFTCVTGVSGSGKSTLINDTLAIGISRALHQNSRQPAPVDAISGIEHLDKIIEVDQSPIGRTPRSNPATYTGLFTPIRELFAGTKESRARGYNAGRFSFNVKGGRCESCQGDGVIKVEMHFLPDVYVPCDVCNGQRYNRETLDIHYKGKNIYDVLEMTIEAAREFFDAIPQVTRKLDMLLEVGLGYIKLGQNATTLSGGEAQRVKLAKELARRDTGRTLYVLDEPTTGLHFHDVAQLLRVLMALRDRGNSVVVIEHNLDVIKMADWIVDLGPEGGNCGGQVVALGPPETVAENPRSHTGRFLKPLLVPKRTPQTSEALPSCAINHG